MINISENAFFNTNPHLNLFKSPMNMLDQTSHQFIKEMQGVDIDKNNNHSLLCPTCTESHASSFFLKFSASLSRNAKVSR